MATTNHLNPLPSLRGSLSNSTITAIPYPPSPVEAKHFYYGIPSRPRLVARSSADVWVEPTGMELTGMEVYFIPKEASPIGLHPLREIWEASVGPAIVGYLDSKGVKWTSLDPVRIGYAESDSSPPAIVWMGVVPGTLSAEDGIEVATHCKSILSAHGVNDTHVEIRESEVFHSAGPKMYKPIFASNAAVEAREPFSTSLGLPICAEATPSIGGTGGFFISDPRHPGKIYLVTARHVVFHPDTEPNMLYQHGNSSQSRRNVLLFSDDAFEEHLKAIESLIDDQIFLIDYLERRLRHAEQLNESEAKSEKKQVPFLLEQAKKALGALEEFLVDVSGNWKKQENRILGYVALSPPIGLNVGEEGFTEDWAVIEIDRSKVDLTNFVGNVIDLGTTIPVGTFWSWMDPHRTKPRAFDYPVDRLLKFCGMISDEEMWKPSPNTLDRENVPVILVIKRGYATGLTVGRLNTIRSFTRVYVKDQPGQVSKEIAVLPRNSTSGAFSTPGDSGSAVIDGKGRLAGLLTGGSGSTEESDFSYITSIHFLCKRMLEHGIKANLSPSLNA